MLFGSSQPDYSGRLAAIERKLDLIMVSLGIAEEAPEYPEIRDLVRMGKKIEAIKLYRERTGVGLAEAKAAVEAM